MQSESTNQVDCRSQVVENPQLQVVPSAEELIERARRASVGLPPRPREATNATLVILVGNPMIITELLVDWLAEAASLLKAPAEAIDREVLGDGLAVPDYIVDGTLDHHVPMHNRSSLSLFVPIGDGHLRLLFKPIIKCLVKNLAGALQVAWRRLTIEAIKQPSRNQFSDALHKLVTSRTDLFSGPGAVVAGLIVLPMRAKQRLVQGPRSEVARRLQGCIKTTPGATTVAGRWLELQAAKRLPGRRQQMVEEEPTACQKPLARPPAIKKSRIREMGADELGWLENCLSERQKRAKRRIKENAKKINKRTGHGRPVGKLEEEARRLRIERRKNRKKLRYISSIRAKKAKRTAVPAGLASESA